MDLLQSLKEKGWHLLNDAVQQISDNNAITNFRTLQQKAIDLDLREIGAPAFPEDIQKGKLESIPGNIVVQVQKVRNVSAPKANEESHAAPRMLKIALTDGHTVCQAIEVEQVAALSLNTPPGTKLRLKHETVNMSHGMLLLEQGSVEVLGGRVTHLVDKWELNRSLAKHTRGRIGEEGGPPPWIPFGQKITRTSLADRNFKSLDESRGGANNENKENAEFEAQRQDAIAEAVRGGAGGGARKVFGGGNARSLVDKNVKQIVDAGFTAQQAEQALHANKNNVARALRMLQKKEVNSGNSEGGRGGGGGGRGRRRGGGGGDKEDDGGGGGGGGGGPKPSGKVSLFDFLEDKLPSQNGKETEPQEQQQQQQQHHNSSHQPHHHHQSNRHHEPRNSGGGSRGGGGGGYNRGGGNRRGGGGGGAAEPPPRSRGGGGEDRAQNQKPPRFQNQQRYQQNNDNSSWPTNNTSYSDSYSGYDSYNGGGYGGKMAARGYDDYSETVGQYGGAGGNKQRQQQGSGGGGGGTQYGGYNDQYRRRYNSNTNVNNYRSSGSNDNYSQQLMDAGMPEIPEFPFKDASSIQPLMSAGFFTASGFLSSSNQQQQQQQQQQAPPPQQQPPPPPTAAPAPLSQYHAPLPSSQPPEQIISYPWKIGEKCMAKYWENNVYYNAEITGLSKNTCVVKFLDYGNYEEVLQDDCIPLLVEGRSHPPLEQSVFNPLHQSQQSNSNHFSGSIEFRRGGTRPFVKSDGGGGGGGAGGGNRRPRGAQQVYVPPAQRGNHPQRK